MPGTGRRNSRLFPPMSMPLPGLVRYMCGPQHIRLDEFRQQLGAVSNISTMDNTSARNHHSDNFRYPVEVASPSP